MTQKDKELLLKDLCARLPYGVKVYINSPIEEQNSMELFDVNFDSKHIGVGNEKWAFRAIPIVDDEDEAKVVKPYLRPLSSMTEEERAEFYKVGGLMAHKVETNTYVLTAFSPKAYDYLNAHHFDYRGLIEKGLALEASKDTYK